jgi:hypothetical protein
MDATAQLKGMLGISGDVNSSASQEKVQQSQSQQSTNNNKSKRNKQKNQQKKQTNQQNKSSSNNRTNKKKNKNKQHQSKPPDTNFAWSAFQSSPDASKLPIPAFLSTEQSNTTNQALPESSHSTSDLQKRTVSHSSQATPAQTMESKTGVNLAALTSSPSPKPALSKMTQQQIPNPRLPPNYPPPQAPPGYITIQVQVPPYLAPDRQMIVQTPPNGYPVQVVVPQGIPPGAIIPVHVPAVPLHMMPPPTQQTR